MSSSWAERDLIRSAVLEWFSPNQRALPWRRNRSPYSVLVSEFMLQQTRAEAVRPYFEKFMERFPTLASLAEAQPEEVLQYWAGLGYYRRARNLHWAVREVADHHGGILPATVSGLRSLSGIGRYTAGAVASIGYDLPAPALDGNVMRVLCRLLALRGDPRKSPLNGDLWDIAASLAEGESPGALNEGLIELGAVVCLPVRPLCQACPVSQWCRARQLGVQSELPELKPPAMATNLEYRAVVILQSGAVLMQQRSTARVWEGLWVFPTDFGPGAPASEAPEAPAWLDPSPFSGVEAPWMVIRHTVMRWRITLRVYRILLPPGNRPPVPKDVTWVTLEKLDQLPLPSPHRRIARMLISSGQPQLFDHQPGS